MFGKVSIATILLRCRNNSKRETKKAVSLLYETAFKIFNYVKWNQNILATLFIPATSKSISSLVL